MAVETGAKIAVVQGGQMAVKTGTKMIADTAGAGINAAVNAGTITGATLTAGSAAGGVATNVATTSPSSGEPAKIFLELMKQFADFLDRYYLVGGDVIDLLK
jgi:hypothetical protein